MSTAQFVSGSVTGYLVLVFLPGLLVRLHPLAGHRWWLVWGVLVAFGWAVHVALQLTGFPGLAAWWFFGNVAVMLVLVVKAVRARRQAAVLKRFDREMV